MKDREDRNNEEKAFGKNEGNTILLPLKQIGDRCLCIILKYIFSAANYKCNRQLIDKKEARARTHIYCDYILISIHDLFLLSVMDINSCQFPNI